MRFDLVALVCLVLLCLGAPGSGRADDVADTDASDADASIWERDHLLPDWIGRWDDLERAGLGLEVVYTGDYIANTRGGISRKSEVLGNLDMTLVWHTEPLLGRDLGTFFLYGLVDHGGRPSKDVGDAQGVDNIEAPDAAKVFEAWWQKAFFDDRASMLLGLYDVNSEFYALDTAEIFLNSSFGIGPELGTSGVNGPSIFPTTSVGARLKAEIDGAFEVQAAVLDGVPGDPGHPGGTRIEFDHGDGVFMIAEVARYWVNDSQGPDGEALRSTRRRHVGREWSELPDVARVALGTWLYTTRLDHVSRTDSSGQPLHERGHPGVYLIAEYDASELDLWLTRGLSVFVQLGWADGDVGQFEGYSGGGFKYTGLLPFRPADECGFGVAAAYNGHAFRRASRAQGDSPARAEVALEWTYQAKIAPWLSIQGDLQYVVDPGGLRNRPDALVAGLRYAVSF